MCIIRISPCNVSLVLDLDDSGADLDDRDGGECTDERRGGKGGGGGGGSEIRGGSARVPILKRIHGGYDMVALRLELNEGKKKEKRKTGKKKKGF
mmetsp:Transcript_46434/g.74675  ORF Transcript_46434/g.74675 Transcript_46434/m.74675 type:complete len:95 (+) Transcript_46434:347-631(+)